jgi:formylglycine-generating enzyme required for sulfatase activity
MKKIAIFTYAAILLLSYTCGGTEPDPEIIERDPVIDVVLVPAGEFEMGDNFGEGQSNELPVHTVYIDTFYIGKYEVTCAEYQKFMDEGGYTNSAYWSAGGYGNFGSEPEDWNSTEWQGGGLAGNENIPVAGVCWYEAMAYCSWLSAKTGQTYRLPTEAEWEKAARGDAAANSAIGHQRRYPWGDDITGSNTNYYHSGDTYENRGGNGGKTPVGYFDGSVREGYQTQDNSSPYGAYDMAGNVWELCLGWYGENYYANSPANNPAGPESGTNRVFRGGGRHSAVIYVRSAFRENGTLPTTRSVTMGFRYVREKTP